MELEDIRRKALAARSFTKEVDGVVFSLRLPTKFDSSTLYVRVSAHEGAMDPAALVRWQRAMLLQALAGWQGALVRHVLPDHDGDDPLPFAPGAAELLLDARPSWEEALTAELLDRRAQRDAREEAAAKN